MQTTVTVVDLCHKRDGRPCHRVWHVRSILISRKSKGQKENVYCAHNILYIIIIIIIIYNCYSRLATKGIALYCE